MAARRATAKKKAAAGPKTRKKARQPKSPRAPRARKKTPRGKKDPGGAPAIVWEGKVVEAIGDLAKFGNTVEDMAVILGVSTSSLEAAISDESLPVRGAYYGGKAQLRDTLRRSQVRTANEGNASMLKWLGVNLLNQRDVKAVEISGSGEGGAVKVTADLSDILVRRLGEFLRSRGKK